jgi:hypothetical protein
MISKKSAVFSNFAGFPLVNLSECNNVDYTLSTGRTIAEGRRERMWKKAVSAYSCCYNSLRLKDRKC